MEQVEHIELGPCRVDIRGLWVEREGQQAILTRNEAAIIRVLLRADGQVVSRTSLAQTIGYSPKATTRAVDTAVARLRAKVEADPRNPKYLETVYGEGYRLNVVHRPVAEANRPLKIRTSAPTVGGPLIGRDRELRLLFSGLRRYGHVSIVGVPGIGKSHLVARAAASWQQQDPQRSVVWIRMAPGDQVMADIDRQLSRITQGDGAPRGLLVLDEIENAEANVLALLERLQWKAPHCRVVSIGRRPVGWRRESLLRLTGLNVPGAVDLLSSLGGLEEPPRELLAAVSTAVGGHPQALRRAATLLQSVPPQELLTRLQGDALQQLSAGRGAALMQSAQAMMSRLDNRERQAVDAMLPFVGGFSLLAIESILADENLTFTLDILQGLADRSLIERVPKYRGRFQLGGLLGMALRHPSYAPANPINDVNRWLDVCVHIGAMHAEQPSSTRRVSFLRGERENLAMAMVSRRLAPTERAQIAMTLSHVCGYEGHSPRCQQLLTDVITANKNDPDSDHYASLLAIHARRALRLGDYNNACRDIAEVLTSFGPDTAGWMECRALSVWIAVDRGQATLDEVVQALNQADAISPIAVRLNVTEVLCKAMTALGVWERVLPRLLWLATTYERHDDTHGQVRVLGMVAHAHWRIGAYLDAREAAKSARSLHLSYVNPCPYPDCVYPLVAHNRLSGSIDEAMRLLKPARMLARQEGWPTAHLDHEYGWLLLEQGDYTNAIHQLSAARRWFSTRDLCRRDRDAAAGLILAHYFRGEHALAAEYAQEIYRHGDPQDTALSIISRLAAPEIIQDLAVSSSHIDRGFSPKVLKAMAQLVDALRNTDTTSQVLTQALERVVEPAARRSSVVRVMWGHLVRQHGEN